MWSIDGSRAMPSLRRRALKLSIIPMGKSPSEVGDGSLCPYLLSNSMRNEPSFLFTELLEIGTEGTVPNFRPQFYDSRRASSSQLSLRGTDVVCTDDFNVGEGCSRGT